MELIGQHFLFNNKLNDASEFNEGFLFRGKNLYEVVRVIEGVPLFLEDHLSRLLSSADKAGLKIQISSTTIISRLKSLIGAINLKEGNIKFIYHFEGAEKIPFFIAYHVEHFYPAPDAYKTGVSVSFMNESRPDPNIKNWRPGFRERVKNMKIEKSVYEVLLINDQGIITEGSQSNLFYIKDQEIVTAHVKNILPGITRKYILQICRMKQIPLRESDFGFDQLKRADAVFLTGTSPGLLPVAQIDELVFNPTNQILKILMDEYKMIISSYIKAWKNEV